MTNEVFKTCSDIQVLQIFCFLLSLLSTMKTMKILIYFYLVLQLNSDAVSVLAPTGTVLDVQIKFPNKNGGYVTWRPPPCSSRNGNLLFYGISVYKLPENSLVLNHSSNATDFEIEGLLPFTSYGVEVVYVNSQGAGPKPVTLTEFSTLEDGMTLCDKLSIHLDILL